MTGSRLEANQFVFTEQDKNLAGVPRAPQIGASFLLGSAGLHVSFVGVFEAVRSTVSKP